MTVLILRRAEEVPDANWPETPKEFLGWKFIHGGQVFTRNAEFGFLPTVPSVAVNAMFDTFLSHKEQYQ